MKKFICILLVALFIFSGYQAKKGDTSNESPDNSTKFTPPEGAVIIALLDTGISTVAIDKSVILEGYNYVENSFDTEDKLNHGTAAASVIVGSAPAKIQGLAPNAYLVPLVVRTKNQSGEEEGINPQILSQVIIDSVDKYKADIINISLGIKKDLPEIKNAIDYAEEKGVLVVSAVGNDGNDTDFYYPAAYERVISVGSHDKDGKVSSFSQKNGTVDIMAPGEDIWLASKKGKTYGTRGTSFAAAYISAVAANIMNKNPNLSPKEIRDIIYKSATDIGDEGFDKESGWGVINLESCLNF
mgnify:CR=1 FL=1